MKQTAQNHLCVGRDALYRANPCFISSYAERTLHKKKHTFVYRTKVCFSWSGVRESNPPPKLGKLLYYRCTNPASVPIIAPAEQKGKQIWNMYRVYAALLCPICEKLRKTFTIQDSLWPRDTKTGEIGCSRTASRPAKCWALSELSNNC